MKQTVIGIFNKEDEARRAVRELESLGFDRSDIDVSSGGSSNALRQETSAVHSTSDSDESSSDDTFGERVSKFFRRMFDDDDESNTYSNAARNRHVVTVQAITPDEAIAASRVLDDAGAIDVNEASDMDHKTTPIRQVSDDSTSVYNRNTSSETNTDDSSRMLQQDENINSDGSRSIPVIEEQFEVGKREVQTGGVRVRSRIVERPVEETLRLREETVNVTRTPADRPATESDLSNFQDSEIELTETAEVPVVNKEARVVEEVRLDKEVEDREEVIRDTVRRTDVEVEKTPKEKKPKKRT